MEEEEKVEKREWLSIILDLVGKIVNDLDRLIIFFNHSNLDIGILSDSCNFDF